MALRAHFRVKIQKTDCKVLTPEQDRGKVLTPKIDRKIDRDKILVTEVKFL